MCKLGLWATTTAATTNHFLFVLLCSTTEIMMVFTSFPVSPGQAPVAPSLLRFAHTPSELRAWPWPTEVAEHWKGAGRTDGGGRADGLARGDDG